MRQPSSTFYIPLFLAELASLTIDVLQHLYVLILFFPQAGIVVKSQFF